MSWTKRDQANRRPDESDALLRTVVLSRLARQSSAPDLTDPIMRRLGYAPLDRRGARRARIIERSGRTALTFVVCAAFLLSIQVLNQRPEARAPAGVSLPGALEHDVQTQGSRLIEFIRDVRQLSPQWPAVPDRRINPAEDAGRAPDPSRSRDREIDESARAPVLWI